MRLKDIISEIIYIFKSEFWLLVLLSLGGVFLAWFGYLRAYELSFSLVVVGLAQKFLLEFFFLGTVLYFLHFLGIRKKWVYVLLMFAYMVTIYADIALLLYFKERFGSKYLTTLDLGADMAFIYDWRFLLLLFITLNFCFWPVKILLKNITRPQALFKFLVSALLMLFFGLVPFYALLTPPKDFYAKYMLLPSPVYILKGVLAREPKARFELSPAAEAEAEEYGLFPASAEPPFKERYTRIILITVESLSAKFLHSYNPEVPPSASSVFDELIANFPSTLVHPGGLSTLYGLSIIYSSHPNARLVYENKYPFSFVKTLRAADYSTIFLRGAAEDYMNEDVHLAEAGFDEILGQKFFKGREIYKDYINWWGLTDRKLFDFAAYYLKEKKNEKVFMNILTLDTHVPLGRPDYFDQDYPPYPQHPAYAQEGLARAFFRLNHDLGLFIERLSRDGLLDEKTLIIITGDHPFYENFNQRKLMPEYTPDYDKLPLIFAGASRVEIFPHEFASQTDVAPSILYLTGHPVPRGVFGKTLFKPAERTLFQVKEDYIKVSNSLGVQTAALNDKKERGLIDLMNTFLE